MKEETVVHQTIEKLSQMKMHTMAAAFQDQVVICFAMSNAFSASFSVGSP
jgi:hypothetical protein